MSDIPPPQMPGQPRSILMVPFVLADSPRLQLEFLSRHPSIPQVSREAIADWLSKYNSKLVSYLRHSGGDEAVRKADALSRMAAQMMNEKMNQQIQQREEDLFKHLQETFYDEE